MSATDQETTGENAPAVAAPGGEQRAVPEHAPRGHVPMVRWFMTRVRKAGIPEDEWRGWVAQITNGATRHLRACTRTELVLVLEMARYRFHEKPLPRRPARPETEATAEGAPRGTEAKPAGASAPRRQGLSRGEREARRAAGIFELPTRRQVGLIVKLAQDLALADAHLEGIAFRAMGLTRLERQQRRAGLVETIRLRKEHKDRIFGLRTPALWRTRREAANVLTALLAIARRRAAAAHPGGQPPPTEPAPSESPEHPGAS